MTLRGLLVVACFLAGSSAANAYSSVNGFTVQPTSGGNFEVQSRGGLSAQNAWCAAGDFAISVLGVNPSTAIWRISEPPRPRGASIVFSLSPVGAATSTGMATLGGGGAAMSAAAARNLCTLLMTPGFRR